MQTILLRLVVFFIMIFPIPIYAVETSTDDVKGESTSRTKNFLILDGINLLNADIDAREPLRYGDITLIMGTTFRDTKMESAMDNHICAGFTSIILYDMTLYRSKVNKGDIRKNNLVLWNLLLISGTLFESEDKKKTVQIKPMFEDGAKLEFKYKF